MATIHRAVLLAAGAGEVWAALRDAGNVHRVFPGVLAGCRMEGDVRVVAFADGLEVRERITAIDDAARRIDYALLRDGLVHHAASMQVAPAEGGCCRFDWTTDVLPDAAAAPIAARVEQGIAALRRRWGEG